MAETPKTPHIAPLSGNLCLLSDSPFRRASGIVLARQEAERHGIPHFMTQLVALAEPAAGLVAAIAEHEDNTVSFMSYQFLCKGQTLEPQAETGEPGSWPLLGFYVSALGRVISLGGSPGHHFKQDFVLRMTSHPNIGGTIIDALHNQNVRLHKESIIKELVDRGALSSRTATAYKSQLMSLDAC